jgi:hypothetical protein
MVITRRKKQKNRTDIMYKIEQVKEVIIFRAQSPKCEEEVKELESLSIKLEIIYNGTNQIPLLITDNIEIIK